MDKIEKNLLINQIESELKSFDEEKKDSYNVLDLDKKKIIEEIKSGSFDEMLFEINNREVNKKKETLIDKLFKLF